MSLVGNPVFISYRNKEPDEPAARRVRDKLTSSGYDVAMFEPGDLAQDNEVMTPYDMFRLMEWILVDLVKCKTFLAINQEGDFQNSYWTQIEVTQWQRFRRYEMIMVQLDYNDSIRILETRNLPALTPEEQVEWMRISFSLSPDPMVASRRSIPRFGRYAERFFLIPCNTCCEHFLASRKLVYNSVNKGQQLRCPHCGAGPFKFNEGSGRRTFYRKPIILTQPVVFTPGGIRQKARILHSTETIALLRKGDPNHQWLKKFKVIS